MNATGVSAPVVTTIPGFERAAVVMETAHIRFVYEGAEQQMTKDTHDIIKQLLKSYRWFPPLIEKAEADLSDINAEIRTVLMGRSSGASVGGSTGPGDPTGASCAEVEHLLEVKSAIEHRLRGYRTKKAWVEKALIQLPSQDRYIVEERFFRDPMPWDEISCLFSKNEKWCRRRLMKAIDALSRMY